MDRNLSLRKNQNRCSRITYVAYGSLIAESTAPHAREDLDRAFDEVTEVVRTCPGAVTSLAMGFWQEGLGWKLRARLGGNEKLIRSRLSRKGWKFQAAPPARKLTLPEVH
jgi:hypothetical protein